MDWKKHITELDLSNKTSSFNFNVPASNSLMEYMQAQFELKELPGELEELYLQTNGVEELIGEQKIGELIWPVDRVVETNKGYRTQPDFKRHYMSFDQLLFISDAGNGDLFGFVTLNGMFERQDIFTWNHETDSRTWVAPDLKTFLKWWTNGTIKV